jgi:hypothetical protein
MQPALHHPSTYQALRDLEVDVQQSVTVHGMYWGGAELAALVPPAQVSAFAAPE